MAQIKVPDGTPLSFNLKASWSCLYRYNSSTNNYNVWTTDAESTESVSFEYNLPANAVIRGAKVHSSWGGSLFGIKTGAINGVEPDAEGFVEIDPSLATETSLTVEFFFEASKDNPRNHLTDEFIEGSAVDKTITLGSHTSSAIVSDVYLLIEYETSGNIYHAENGELVPYKLYRAEGGVLVPYQIQHAEDGALAPYGG